MRVCGIYGIFNSINGKVLVGSSTHIHRRWYVHKRTARLEVHGNPHFQSAWKEYGESAFEFRILEMCAPDMLIIRENSHMDYLHSLDPNFGYNTKNASQSIVSCETRARISRSRQGIKFSAQHRQHLSESRKGQRLSEECKHKISSALKGKRRPDLCHPASQETKDRRSLSLKQYWAKHPECKAASAARLEAYHASGIKRPFLGRHHSDATKKRLSGIFTGRVMSSESRLKMSLSQLGRTPSNKGKPMLDEQKKKLREAWERRRKAGTAIPWNKGIPMSAEMKQRMSAQRTGRRHSESTRLKMSISQKKRQALLIAPEAPQLRIAS